MQVGRRSLLRTIEAYESRHGVGPTVHELATYLGIPADFGHLHLVDRLKRESALEHLSDYRGRFTLTAAGRRALDSDDSPRPTPPQTAPAPSTAEERA